MSSIDAKHAAAARAARRRHLQQRQTVIFGSLIAGLLVIGLAAGAMWVGILPSPVNIPIHSPEPESTAPPPPCPAPDATPIPYGEIAANVFNGTTRAGLAAGTAAGLAERGVSISGQENAPVRYDGVARIVTGPTAVAEAYTLAALFPEADIELDGRTEDVVDVIVGDGFEGLLPAESVELEDEAPIPPLAGCEPVTIDDPEDEDSEDGDGGDEGDED